MAHHASPPHTTCHSPMLVCNASYLPLPPCQDYVLTVFTLSASIHLHLSVLQTQPRDGKRRKRQAAEDDADMHEVRGQGHTSHTNPPIPLFTQTVNPEGVRPQSPGTLCASGERRVASQSPPFVLLKSTMQCRGQGCSSCQGLHSSSQHTMLQRQQMDDCHGLQVKDAVLHCCAVLCLSGAVSCCVVLCRAVCCSLCLSPCQRASCVRRVHSRRSWMWRTCSSSRQLHQHW